MSPHDATPASKLLQSPRPLCQNQVQVSYSTQEGVRALQLPPPSTGTSASGYIPGHSRDGHSARSQAQSLIRGQAQAQGCGDSCRANSVSPVVLIWHVDRATQFHFPSREKVGRPEKQRASTCAGDRQPVQLSVLSTQGDAIQSGGSLVAGGTAKTLPRTLVNSGVQPVASRRPVGPTSGARLICIVKRRNSSSSTTTTTTTTTRRR